MSDIDDLRKAEESADNLTRSMNAISSRKVSMQDRLREQRNAGSSSHPDKLSQGETYSPSDTTTARAALRDTMGVPKEDDKPKSEESKIQPQANQTIINTTRTDDTETKSILSNKFVLIGIALVAIFVLLLLFKDKIIPDKNKEPTPTPTPELEWIEPEPVVFQYTWDEVARLRQVGYTGDEIEEHEILMTSVDELVRLAEEERQAWMEAEIAPMFDTASDEFKQYVSETWLSLPERTDASEWTNVASYYQERKNLDYEKISVHGNQLFIKIYLDDNNHNNWFYLNVTPEEWNKLNDSGNVIVTYTYCTKMVTDTNDAWGYYEDTSSIFITDAILEIIE